MPGSGILKELPAEVCLLTILPAAGQQSLPSRAVWAAHGQGYHSHLCNRSQSISTESANPEAGLLREYGERFP